MEQTFKTAEAVRPLFVTQDGNSYHFGGTGFFIVHNGSKRLVTANHVIGDLDVFVFVMPEGTAGFEITSALKPTKLLARSTEHDLAVLDVVDFDPGTTLSLAQGSPASNLRVGTLEYSRFELNPNERTLNPNPSTRVGNIVRQLTGDKYFPDSSLELSYPALRGASGSPVVILEGNEQFKVCGIVVANAQYELMPVQTYSYKDVVSTEEEKTHYYLPSGVAINVFWLSQLLATIATDVPDSVSQPEISAQ